MRLADKSEQLGRSLQRFWVLQSIAGGLGFLYIFSPELSEKILDRQGIDLRLMEVGLPALTLYLFGNMGFTLGGYVETRRALMRQLGDGRELEGREERIVRSGWTLATLNNSIFQLVVGLGDKREVWLDHRSTHTRPARISATVMFILVIAVFEVSNGLATYLVYRLLDGIPEPVQVLAPLLFATAIALLHWLFYQAMKETIGNFVARLVWFMSAIGLSTFVWLAIADPLVRP